MIKGSNKVAGRLASTNDDLYNLRRINADKLSFTVGVNETVLKRVIINVVVELLARQIKETK